MATHFKILISDPLHPDALTWLQNQKNAQLTVKPDIDKSDLLKIIGEFDAIVVRSRTKVDSDIIAAGHRLKIIARAGTGLDNVDVKTAQARKIQVLNAPGANANAVAELVIGLMLEMARDLHVAFHSAKENKKMEGYGSELQDKTLGILGCGQIGRRVAHLAQAFGMRTIAYDVIVTPAPGVEFVSLEKLYRESDIITLHVPLLDQTRHLIDAKALEQLKHGVFLINTARGELVDEMAIMKGLASGKIKKYASDFFAPHSPLLSHKNTLLTPHIGASTAEAQRRAGMETVEKVYKTLLTGTA
jgi:D-3-phosphoglycerate dehydrogenase